VYKLPDRHGRLEIQWHINEINRIGGFFDRRVRLNLGEGQSAFFSNSFAKPTQNNIFPSHYNDAKLMQYFTCQHHICL
jgi:hypothetical protein